MSDRKDESEPLASPACGASEANDVYMGFAGPAEIAAFLAELAEAEGAGRPVADMIGRMLPRIRDGQLHATLAARRGSGCFALPGDGSR